MDADGTKKYTLGFFGDYWEAENFKKYLREMGVKDAWIVAYKNGSRVELKDVLENSTSVSSKSPAGVQQKQYVSKRQNPDP